MELNYLLLLYSPLKISDSSSHISRTTIKTAIQSVHDNKNLTTGKRSCKQLLLQVSSLCLRCGINIHNRSRQTKIT